MIVNARKKIEELKETRENIVQEADKFETESKEKIKKAEETEERIEELMQQMQKLEVQRDQLKTREVDLVEKVEVAEKRIRENSQTYSLLKEKKERTDSYVEKLTKELSQLKKENKIWMKKYEEMTCETKKCEDTLKKRAEKAMYMHMKSKKMEVNMTLVKNTARCVQVETTASTRRNSVKEERIGEFSVDLPNLTTTFEEGEKKAVQLETITGEKEEELKHIKERYIVLKNEYENIIADIGH